jgi:hypothetical protein
VSIYYASHRLYTSQFVILFYVKHYFIKFSNLGKSVMKSLILHLGLPKTGTTFLQKQCFPKVRNCAYLGKSYANGNDRVRDKLVDLLECDEKKFNESKDAFLSSINSIDEERLLISDEMMIVDTGKATWQKKIERLSRLFENNDVKLECIFLLFRDPLQASYSFYVETYNLHKHKYPEYEDFVLNSNQSKIYNFSELVKVMKGRFNQKNIKIISYESLKKSEKGLAGVFDIIDVESASHGGDLTIKENTKKVVGGDYVANNKTLKDFLITTRLAKFFIGALPRRYYKWISYIVGKVNVTKGEVVHGEIRNEEAVLSILNVTEEKSRRPSLGSFVYNIE